MSLVIGNVIIWWCFKHNLKSGHGIGVVIVIAWVFPRVLERVEMIHHARIV